MVWPILSHIPPRSGSGEELDRDLGSLLQADLEHSQRKGSKMGQGEVLVGVLGSREERAGLVEVAAGKAG